MHWAYDIQGKGGSKKSKGKHLSVRSPLDGVIVVDKAERCCNGTYIIDDHGNYIRLLHMEYGRYVPGDKVKKGDLVGFLSDVGSPGSIHLHFEVG
jgi:murein DD-endopeptidase MepM/ murein hydrolase activator NlpD